MILSEDQEQVLEQVDSWRAGAEPPVFQEDTERGKYTVGTSHDYPVCAVGGYAGTGKTTILRVVGEADPFTVFVTPTHKAASVLRSKLPYALALRVRTFHSLIYRANPLYKCKLTGLRMEIIDDTCTCGLDGSDFCECVPVVADCAAHARSGGDTGSLCSSEEELRFERRDFLAGHYSCIAVDEASMLTEQEVQDIRSFGVPVLLIGDHGQLPPVQAAMNRWIKTPKLLLTENHRQNETSGIIQLADHARTSGILRPAVYGDSCQVIDARSERAASLMERFIPDCLDRAVIVRYNQTRANLNRMWNPEGVVKGTRLICLQRIDSVPVLDDKDDVTHDTLIFNRSLATVEEITYTTGSGRIVECVARLDSPWRRGDSRVLIRLAADQLGRPDKLDHRDKPGGASLWDYASAITAHVAQGSEFRQVVVIHEGPPDKRFLYTAVTRARDAVVVLNL